MPIEKITGVVKDYAWGTLGGIDSVRGIAASDRVQAEWWLGDHPQGVAHVSATGAPLSDWLVEQGHDGLGFLLKVLVPASPLSLQVHPTSAQAERGFDREEAAGIPVGDATRLYRDRFAKPELVVAVAGCFDALAGNASTDAIGGKLRALVSAGYPEDVAVGWLERLRADRAGTVGWLLGGSPDARETVGALGPVADSDPLLEVLWSHYPGDAGCAVALMLNRVRLAKGEALYLEAGQPHAYLSGVGIELMAPSDNVLRGGLTPKHIDVAELMAVASFDESPPPLLAPHHRSQLWAEYAPAGEAFSLHRVDSRGSSDRVEVAVNLPAVCLSLDAGAVVSVAGELCALSRGEAAVIAHPGGHAQVEVLGDSAVWIAHRR